MLLENKGQNDNLQTELPSSEERQLKIIFPGYHFERPKKGSIFIPWFHQ
jgi:hypothetical protein